MSTTTPTVLRRICDRKREEIAERKRQTTVAELIARAEAQSAPRGFIAALQQRVRTGSPAVIAEIKKARGMVNIPAIVIAAEKNKEISHTGSVDDNCLILIAT